MALEEFEVNGQKYVFDTEEVEETGVAFKDKDNEFEKTQEIEVINENLLDETLTDVFGENDYE